MPISTYVLIPGAWHGGWSWRPVAERLRAAGHGALALTLPGLADGDDPTGLHLQDAVDYVVHEVETRDLTEVILVAHSWGGYPMTGAAHRLAGRVSKIVYYNAEVPARGAALVDENSPEGSAWLRGLVESSPNRAITPSLEWVQQLFMQDASEDAQRLVSELVTPQPGDYFLEALDVPDVTTLGVPVVYILSEDDQALPLPGVEFAARLGLKPLMVPGSHNGLLTQPDALATALLDN